MLLPSKNPQNPALSKKPDMSAERGVRGPPNFMVERDRERQRQRERERDRERQRERERT